ncbi:hypothetical protein LINPERPRIM_LOCUS7232, partial [Linum perenne]
YRKPSAHHRRSSYLCSTGPARFDAPDNPVLWCPDGGEATSTVKVYYPSFPFGQLLNPIPAGGLDLVETEDEEVVDDAYDKTMHADSVKKKRKKKVNKHKYKKLRKRLRRKSRS